MEICKHDEFCGGCIYQGTPYEEQLRIKEQEVLSLLEKKGVACGEILPIEPAPSQYRYRNKMEYTFGDMEKGGDMTLGMHRKKHFMSIVTVDQCQLVHEDFNRVLRATLDFCQEKGYSFYHKKSHKGLLRHLIVRRGVHTGELLVNLVTSTEPGFDEEGYVQLLQQLPLEHTLVGILRTFNDSLADAVKCDELKTLWGRDYYMERIMDLDFKVSAFSFFQTNVEAVERLYSYAINLIDDFSGKVAFDLFCGTGTITQTLAKKARKAVGVELVEEAVAAAKSNAALNGLDNCQFIAGDVFEVLETVTEKPDVIVVDPPRMGISPKALDKIISYGVEQMVYVSCNPKTLVENLYYLQYYGYEVKSLKPFDNFAGTRHTECVALVVRKG
ncbi:23S rRNA (uracil(1939)-C(5))-methyltransferase RlmD [Ihubacter massiliensis]|uniref:23S rRNA (Uracil(1939)-C(5))-methyltransferase RlmD n=1 Tax=Hominibacterium faecale TaxID=2839743 RepID=A0A9J6QPX5_9FIRM|nr:MULTISPECIES: 23S rRNA (uracil(1939)-C(5))-methyltransferase RlmD [Eubacteriales Family XIII. Incertae Sedis]MCO7121134.1 23S rRNA (uracil(1939)-C(5))-methyltransferase RlmD [Ihubacter massiliensis]MCU7378050.1 23S rRNA (uracil(1939)-C(5))-methyltransferase RlmD [Hominibacterium faecale]